MNIINIINFPYNIDTQTIAFIAVLIELACVEHHSAVKQNNFGNWLILVGQFIITTDSQQQLIERRQ